MHRMAKTILTGIMIGILVAAISHWSVIAGRLNKPGGLEHDEGQTVATVNKAPNSDSSVGSVATSAQAEVDELKHEEEQIGSMILDAQSDKSSPARRLSWPLPKNSDITSPFGMRNHPLLHVPVLHAGIDIAARQGVPVEACGDGKVIVVTTLQAYGTIIIIDHGGELATVYAHLSAVDVREGQVVAKGVVIGETGQTGNVTGPHLHLEVRVNGEPNNPLDYVRLPK